MQSRRRDYLGRPLKDSTPFPLSGESLPSGELPILMSRPFILKSKIPSVADVGLQFSINGQVKQAGTVKDMIFGVPKLISFVSSIMRLEVCPITFH